MRKKGKKNSGNKKHLANVLLATAIIELLIKLIDLIQSIVD